MTNHTHEQVMTILPLPPKCLSPNRPPFSRGGRFKKAAAIKKCRKIARRIVKEKCIETGPWEKVEVKAFFYHKTKRRRDGANFNAMLKGYFDGIVDAELVVDDNADHWTTLPPEFRTDKGFPRVEILVTRVI